MKSLLIADSGSTKTAWRWAADAGIYSNGLNPMLLSSTAIVAELQSQLLPTLEAEKLANFTLYFYGAGCGSGESAQKMQAALAEALPTSSDKIHVFSDIYAAIYATCGLDSGVCTILGTGSNTCIYDGESQKITAQIPALGYLLGDEGSGVALGRALLQAYFYEQLPKEMRQELTEIYPVLARADFLAQLYSAPRPNQFLAQFARCLPQFKAVPAVQDLVRHCFEQFFRLRLLPYQRRDLAQHFIGSVAFAWQEILAEICAENQLQIGRVLASPFPQLWEFHQSAAYVFQK
jgi:N-acetylglucosamine kinase-like BadF-type ATPase